MNTTLVLGAGDSSPSIERSVSSRISSEQPAGKDLFDGKVEVYDFTVPARIPTIFKGSYTVCQIMGRERGDIIVSPNGGIAASEYLKPVVDLKRDTGESGMFSGRGVGARKSTEEDTERYWLLRNEGFRNDLVAAGWSIFPEFKVMAEYEQKSLGLNVSGDIKKREFRLNDFIRVLRAVSSKDDVDYSCQIEDLQQLTQFGNDFQYFSQNFSQYFSLIGKYKGRDILLKLERVEDIFPERNNYVPGTSLTRSVPIDSGLPQGQDDLHNLVNEYAEQNGIYTRWGYMGNRGQIIEVKDRKFSENTTQVNTTDLLDRAQGVDAFIKNMVQRESRLAEEQRVSRLNSARADLGLLVK